MLKYKAIIIIYKAIFKYLCNFIHTKKESFLRLIYNIYIKITLNFYK